MLIKHRLGQGAGIALSAAFRCGHSGVGYREKPYDRSWPVVTVGLFAAKLPLAAWVKIDWQLAGARANSHYRPRAAI